MKAECKKCLKRKIQMPGKCPAESLALEISYIITIDMDELQFHFLRVMEEESPKGRWTELVTASSLPLNFFRLFVRESCRDLMSLSFFSRSIETGVGLRKRNASLLGRYGWTGWWDQGMGCRGERAVTKRWGWGDGALRVGKEISELRVRRPGLGIWGQGEVGHSVIRKCRWEIS